MKVVFTDLPEEHPATRFEEGLMISEVETFFTVNTTTDYSTIPLIIIAFFNY